MTADEIKALIETPAGLLVALLFGTVWSIFKQIRDARANGATISFGEYFWRLETLMMFLANVGIFVGLIMTGDLTWQAVVASIGLGHMANDSMDLKPGGRSAAIVDSIPDSAPTKPPV